MTVPNPQTPSGEGVERCPQCGASLAADQRYCLNCGQRHRQPRIDFRRYTPPNRGSADLEETSPVPVPGPPGAPPSAGKPERDFAPLAAAGGIAVLGLMLLVGVLIGRGEGNAGAPAPAPVVRVEGAGGSGAPAAGAADGEEAEKGGAAALGSKGRSKGREKAVKAPPPAAVASEEELEALESKSPQEYSESSAKLPDEIATPGTAPPTDGKAPGGGGKGTAIE